MRFMEAEYMVIWQKLKKLGLPDNPTKAEYSVWIKDFTGGKIQYLMYGILSTLNNH